MSHTELTPIKNEVLETVLRIHPDATPCGSKTQWPECFQDEPEDRISFWYNIGKNTHMVIFNKDDKHLVGMIGGKKFLEGVEN